MSNTLLTIQHGEQLFSPPVEEGVKIEWERTGSPGKLTFTVVSPPDGGIVFTEGDAVCFYFDDKPVFMGYIFKRKFEKDGKIQVTCYDQLRYLKNKFTYVFENKTASQIVEALCKDFNLKTGKLDDTKYVIPTIAEDNQSGLDIMLTVLQDTTVNTGEMFVLFDEFGQIRLRNVADMVCSTLIYSESAEDFNYSSSIDSETYNQVILYYKKDDKIAQMYTAQSPTTIKQWGTLRYFEEVRNPTIGQNQADMLLRLYNKKTRELKVTGAFGDVTVRGGTLIPVQLELGDTLANNYMLVEKVTHHFNNGQHTMDLTLEGAWKDPEYETVSKTIGSLSTPKPTGGTPTTAPTVTEDITSDEPFEESVPSFTNEGYTFSVSVFGLPDNLSSYNSASVYYFPKGWDIDNQYARHLCGNGTWTFNTRDMAASAVHFNCPDGYALILKPGRNTSTTGKSATIYGDGAAIATFKKMADDPVDPYKKTQIGSAVEGVFDSISDLLNKFEMDKEGIWYVD